MKINPSKLLPQAKSSLVKVEKPSLSVKEKRISVASSIKLIKLKSTDLTKEIGENKKTKDVDDVNNKLIKIEKFLKTDLLVSQKKSEVKRKEKEKSDFDKAEKQLEEPKSKKFKMPGISGPSLGFLDRLKRFLFFTALGWLVPKIIEFLPKLEGFANIIGGIYKFAEGLFGKLFDGFMSLVKFGGDLKDKTLGFIAQATGGDAKNFEDKFNQLEKTFNNFVNISIVAGVLSADIGLAAVDEYNKWNKKNKTPDGKTKPREGGKPPTGKPTVTEGKGGQKPTGKPTVTEGRGGQKPTGKPKITGDVKPSWLNKLKGPFAALKGPFARFAGVAVPGLGAAVGAADAAARFKEGDKIGGSLASVSAALDAGTAIAALTGIGLPIAGILGTISMSIDVILLVRDILRVIPFIPDKLLGFYKGGRVLRKYQGGGTTRKGRPVGGTPRRTINVTRRKSLVKVIPPKSQPGKDVGGERKIKRLYPDTGKRFITKEEWQDSGSSLTYNEYLVQERQNEGKRPNPYKALTNTAKILKDIPLVGGIMGAAVDIALGQKPSRDVYRSISSGIQYLVERLAIQNVGESIDSLSRELMGFADGGYVKPTRELAQTYDKNNIENTLQKIFASTINQKIQEAIKSVKEELGKKSTTQDALRPGSNDDTTPFDYEVSGGEKPSNYPGRYLKHGYKGRDYEIGVGNAVTVFAPGVVTYAEYNSGGFGRLVIVKHSNGQESYYAHLSKINVRVGESISGNGTVVGLTGGDPSDPKAGRSDGPHLHFELRDSQGNRITEENSGDNFFRFGTIKSARPRVGILRPGEAGKPGQKFSIPQLVTLAKKAGFRGNNAAVAAAVAFAESTGNSKALNDNPRTGDLSYGLWQINMINDLGPDRRKKYGLKTNEELWDPAVNANVAYKMSGGSNFSSWSTYRSINGKPPKYLKFLPEAQKALQKGDVALPEQPKVPSLKPTIPQMGGQQIEYNYGMKVGDEFVFTGPDGKKYKAHKTARGFDFYTTGLFGIGSQKLDTTGGKNQNIVDAFIRERQRAQSNQKSSVSGKVSIYSGHADMTKNSKGGFGTPGGIQKLINPNFLSNEAYINDLIARKVAAKASGVAVYRAPIKTDEGRDPNSNWERARRDVSSGIIPFEMHHDEPRGSAGLMMGSNSRERLKNPFIKSLSNTYGIHSNSEDKGFFKYGGAILEISALTPSILKDQKTINAHVEKESSRIAGSLTANKMQSGGIIGQSKPKIPIPNSFASYENYEGDMTIAIQPIYIRENSTPLSARETILAFPVLTGVNNNSDIGRYRG